MTLSREVNQTEDFHVSCDGPTSHFNTHAPVLIINSGSNPKLTENVYSECLSDLNQVRFVWFCQL